LLCDKCCCLAESLNNCFCILVYDTLDNVGGFGFGWGCCVFSCRGGGCLMGVKLIPGIILLVIGVLFFFNNKNMGEGAFKFYRVIYTKKNLAIMFRIAGVVLFVGGLVLVFVK